jgi:broad specificity phosphatase PhoE
MAVLYLVRHARTIIDPGVPASNWGLDPAGAAALAELAGRACFAGAHQIVSSSEPKALLTAEAIRSRHGLPPVEVRDALRELHKGSFVGDRHDEVMAEVFAHPERPVLPGWECAADAQARVAGEIDRLVAESRGRDLIVVSHGVVLALYLARVRGQAQVDFHEWRAMRMPDCFARETE